MKISTRMRYGMRALCELAAHYPIHVSLQQIASCQDLSIKYLEQIMSRLRAGGVVKAATGMHGGYVLTHEPERVKVIDAYRSLEGDPSLVHCVEANAECSRSRRCPTRCLWRAMTDAMVGVMEQTTLGELLRRQGRNCTVKAPRKAARS